MSQKFKSNKHSYQNLNFGFLSLVWIEINGGKRKEMIWRDGDPLVWIAKRKEEDLKGTNYCERRSF